MRHVTKNIHLLIIFLIKAVLGLMIQNAKGMWDAWLPLLLIASRHLETGKKFHSHVGASRFSWFLSGGIYTVRT